MDSLSLTAGFGPGAGARDRDTGGAAATRSGDFNAFGSAVSGRPRAIREAPCVGLKGVRHTGGHVKDGAERPTLIMTMASHGRSLHPDVERRRRVEPAWVGGVKRNLLESLNEAAR